MTTRVSTGLRDKMLGMETTLAINGSFTSATTGWTAVDSVLASIASGQSGNCLEIAETGGANPGQAYQDVTTIADRPYWLEFYFKQGTSSAGRALVGVSGDTDAYIDTGALTDASWTYNERVLIPTTTTTRISLITDDATATETSLFDEVKLFAVEHGARGIFRNGRLNIYTGAQPATADMAATGTLLCTYTLDGAGSNGFRWDEPVTGTISKLSTETWQGTALATGTAGYFIYYEEGDDPSLVSTLFARFTGAVATSGAELNLSSTSIVLDAIQTITSATFTIPAS